MHIAQIPTPALIVDQEALRHNVETMRGYIEESGAALKPHYKSFKNTKMARHLIEDGAAGITCAKLTEAEDLAMSGIPDILIANQIVDEAKIDRLAQMALGAKVTVCVDDADNIRELETAAAAKGTVIRCLVEYDVGMGRCGVYDPDSFLRLAVLVRTCPHLQFEGIQAYAGHLSHEIDHAARERESERVERILRELKEHLVSHGVRVPKVSGTSTGTIEFRRKGTVYTEVQPGSYLFMDTSYRALGLPFENALFLLVQVIGENARSVITDGGLKTLSLDQLPPIFADFPAKKVKLSEEHAAIDRAGTELKIKDKLRMIPGHCCTTVNLHDYFYLVSGDEVLDKVPITGRGKSQ